MKKTLLALSLALGATAAFAQTVMTPTELCMKISRVNSSNGNVCAQLISRNIYEPQALNLSSRALDAHGSSSAIQILNATANKRYDSQSFSVCEAILPVNSANVIPCLSIIENATFAQEAIRMSKKQLAGQGSSAAISMLRATANVYLFPPAARICEEMIAINSSNAVVCIQVIANKITLNGSEQICRTALSNGSSYALECLRGIVTDYTPIPQPTTVMVDLNQLQDLRRSLLKAKAQLDRGMIENATRTLEEASQTMNVIMNSNGVQ